MLKWCSSNSILLPCKRFTDLSCAEQQQYLVIVSCVSFVLPWEVQNGTQTHHNCLLSSTCIVTFSQSLISDRWSWHTVVTQLTNKQWTSKILTIASLYVLELISYLRRHHQFVELNSNIHAYNTRRKMDIHIQSYKTDLYKRSVVNIGSKLYDKLPDYIKKKIDSYKTFRKELKSFLLLHTFYSVEEFVAL
jgi:Ca2+/H+ antiporter